MTSQRVKGREDEAADQTKRRRRAPNAAPMGPAHFMTRPTGSMSQTLFDQLHDAILTMKMPPGTPILEKEIAAQSGVSRTPFREALLRLSEEQLVEIVPKSGSYVARIPLSALPEAQIARRALERATVRAAAQLVTPNDIAALRAILDDQLQAAGKADALGFHKSDEAFHALIAQIGKLPGLWRLVQQVKVQIDRFRCLTLQDDNRMVIVHGEHKAIVDAIERGDMDHADAEMEAHLAGLQLRFQDGAKAYPTYFIHDVVPDQDD